MSTVRLIPGTALPIAEPDGAYQSEGRGTLEHVDQGHVGPPLHAGVEPIDREWAQSPDAATIVEAALRVLMRGGLRQERSTFDQTGVQTDANGNAVQKLFTCPDGWESHLTFVSVDVSDPAIHASAPYAAAAAFAFLAIGGFGDVPGANVLAVRAASVHLWPNPASTTGPIIPAEAFWNSDDGPVLFGGESLYYCLKGSAAIANHQLIVNARLENYGPA
jgi:hypothetical protein